MKNFKKNLIVALVIIILINLIAPATVVRAASTNHVTISIPALDFESTYEDVYSNADTANEHPITLCVSPEEFPVTATIYGYAGESKEYTFDTYGTKLLEVHNCSGNYNIFRLAFYWVGGALCPEKYAYATIIIERPEPIEESAEQSTETETDNSTTEAEPNNVDSDLCLQLESVFNKMIFTNDSGNSLFQTHYSRDIEDYLNETWNGIDVPNVCDLYGVISIRSLRNRSYHWKGFNTLTGEDYNEVIVNIDYIGPCRTIESDLFTLSIDDSTGIIEQWELLELTDLWKIPIENESIEMVIPMSYASESDFQATVSTIDKAGVTHMYSLYPNGCIKKLY